MQHPEPGRPVRKALAWIACLSVFFTLYAWSWVLLL